MTIKEKILGASCFALMIASGFFLYEIKFASHDASYRHGIPGEPTIEFHTSSSPFLLVERA